MNKLSIEEKVRVVACLVEGSRLDNRGNCWLTRLIGWSMNPQCDCSKLLSPARILNLDGQVIATGLIKLQSPDARGQFDPDILTPSLKSLGTQAIPKVVAEIGTHRHELFDFQLCAASAMPHKPHFHFRND